MRYVACALAVVCASLTAAAQPAPDCARARSAVARAICSDPALKAADSEMVRVFDALRAALPIQQHSTLLADQRQWAVERDAACQQEKSAFAACLRRETEARRRFLAGEGPNGATAAPRLLPAFDYQASKTLRYAISIRYPQIRGPADAAAVAFNKQSRAIAFGTGANSADAFRNSEPPPADQPAIFYDASYEIAYLDARLVSVVFSIASYEGGAHPNGASVGLLFDFNRGRSLDLSDFLADPRQVVADIAARCKQQAEAADWGLFDNPDFASVVSDVSSWAADKDGIRILFNPYSVAPYMAGPHECRLAYAELARSLKPSGPLPPKNEPARAGGEHASRSAQIRRGDAQ